MVLKYLTHNLIVLTILELQGLSGLSLVDLWLGLLLGDTGCLIERRGTGGDDGKGSNYFIDTHLNG
jgi:hypothetical protein